MTLTTTDKRLVAIVLVALATVLVVPFGLMGTGMFGGPMGGPMMGGTWGGMWADGGMSGWYPLVALVVQLLFLSGLVGALYLGFRLLTRPDEDTDQALETLRTAYARGDLSDEEYERRKAVLERDD